jgi:hydrogenase/urease accessory protein HupE
MESLEPSIYLLCLVTSVICLWLLARGYRRTRVKLLLWTSIAFVAFALNNFFLFLDVVLYPNIDFMLYRSVVAVAAVVIMFYGLVWETDGGP